VRDGACDADFAVEARQTLGTVGQTARQELEGDRLAEQQIVGSVHLAHAAAAEQPDDAEAARRAAFRS
jgi:hypothetical protein